MAQGKAGRIALFDNVKGVAIVLVVLGHVLSRTYPLHEFSHLGQALLTFIYFFHMPVFFFVSGLFAGVSWRKRRTNANDKFLLYLCLYLIFCLAVTILDLVFFGKEESINPFVLESAPWFLLALALMMLFVPLLGNVHPAAMLVASIVLAVGAGMNLVSAAELTLLRVFTYFPYFAIGFYLTPARVQGFVQVVRGKVGAAGAMVLGTVLLCAVLVVLYCCFTNEELVGIKYMSSGVNLIPKVAAYMGLAEWKLEVFRVVQYALVMGVMALLFLAVPLKRCGVLTALGERSLQVYMGHVIVMYIMDFLGAWEPLCGSSGLWLAISIVFAVALALVLAWPKSPNTWVSKLGALCKRAVSHETPAQG